MSRGILFLLAFLEASSGSAAPRPPDPSCLLPIATPAAKPCGSHAKSRISGDTLYVEGLIDGMTYELLMRDNAGLALRRVELNSYGGDEEIGELLARFVRDRGLSTRVREGAMCASTCVLVYQAGVRRSAHPSARFGLHGVRLAADYYFRKYLEACGPEGSQEACDEHGRWCEGPEAEEWREQSLEATHEYFGLLGRYGAHATLLDDYLAQGRDPAWCKRANGLRIKDWELDAELARSYGIVVEIR